MPSYSLFKWRHWSPAHPRSHSSSCWTIYASGGQWRVCTDCTNLLSDVSLRWDHMPYGSFLYVADFFTFYCFTPTAILHCRLLRIWSSDNGQTTKRGVISNILIITFAFKVNSGLRSNRYFAKVFKSKWIFLN